MDVAARRAAMERVWIAADPAEAHLVAAALRVNGIDAVVREDDPQAPPDRDLAHPVQPTVWVRAEDAARARALVAHVDPRRIAVPPPHCEGCGDPS